MTSTHHRLLGRVGIGTRIAGGSFLIALVLCVLAGLLLNTRVEEILRANTESVLASEAAPYAEAIRTEPGESFDKPGPSQHVAVVDPAGKVRISTLDADVSRSLRAGDLDPGTQEVRGSGTSTGASTSGATKNADSGSIVRLQTLHSADGDWQIVAARPIAEEAAVLTPMRALLIASLTIIACAVLLASLLLTSASLRPVRRIRQTAERLIDTPSEETLPVGTVDDEISQLARTLNELIGKLRASAQRERQLVSDASHELRTPLAMLRTRLELARAEPRSFDELQDDIAGAERSAVRLTSLVDSLLLLSSIEAADPSATTAADLEEEVREAVDRAVFRAGDLPGAIDINDDISLEARTARFALRTHDLGRVVDNLLSNALKVSSDGDRIDVECHTSSEALTLIVSDTGGGMPEDFADRAFDRFSQSDESRAQATGTGLGLAIVAAIVDRAHGTIDLVNRPGSGVTVLIVIPIAEAPAVESE